MNSLSHPSLMGAQEEATIRSFHSPPPFHRDTDLALEQLPRKNLLGTVT